MLGKDLIAATLFGGGGGSSGGGGGAAAVSPKEVNFYDYDGTCVHAYTVAEAQALSELPAGPEHPGLVFQGWNWSLEGVKGLTRAMNIGAMYTTDDGTTRLYITLQEGRTSPMLGVGVNGTVTVDWGDGTEPDVLTGTSAGAVAWTPTHSYAAPGDYVIRLTVDGEMGIISHATDDTGCYLLRYSSKSDKRNLAYRSSITKIEIGDSVVQVNMRGLYGLQTVTMSGETQDLATTSKCHSLKFLCVPNAKGGRSSSGYTSRSMEGISMPETLAALSTAMFQTCTNLTNVTIHEKVEWEGSIFNGCEIIGSFPFKVKDLSSSALSGCNGLSNVVIDGSVTRVDSQAFYNCYSLAIIDFTACTAVPSLAGTSAFTGIPADCEIRVPAALYDEWIAATNWATYADKIKAY